MRPPSVDEAIAQANRVATRLRAEGAVGWANSLESCIAEMRARYPAKEALLTIGGWCHAKALGEAIQAEDWGDEVAQLRDCCVLAFNELEQTPPDPTFWE